MPRSSPDARAASAWKIAGQKHKPPRHMSAPARRIWQEIVADRPRDYFRPGSLLLLEQLCEVMVAQRAALAQLARTPGDPDIIKAAKDLAAVINSTAVKLRLSVQSDVDRSSRKLDEREPKSNVLLGTWTRSA